MSQVSRSLYQLHLNEVYPRQALYGFQLSPDGQRFVFVQQREPCEDKRSVACSK